MNRSLLAPRARPVMRTLRPDEVEVWQASLDAQPAAVVQFLQTLISAEEAERAHRFHFERDRRRFVVGRGILRTILSQHVGRAPRELVFHYGANGKPTLAIGSDAPPVHFNVSHSDGLALFAVTTSGEVGVDLERIRELPEWEHIATSCFPPRELGRLMACPEARRAEEFFRIWTQQEAVLKALGIGLGGAARNFPPRRAGLDEEPPHGQQAEVGESGFMVHQLSPAADYAAALAVGRGVNWSISHAWHARDPLEPFLNPPRGRRVRLNPISPSGGQAT